MIEIYTKFDLNAVKQLLLYGVIFAIVLGIGNGVLLPKMPYASDIGGYIGWFVMFLLASLLLAGISVVLLMVSGTFVKRFMR